MTGIAEAVDSSHGIDIVMSIATREGQKPEVGNQYIEMISEFNRIGRLGSVKQAALLTRDGLLIKEIPEKTCTGFSAAMMAASLGAAETAFAEIRKGIPEMMVLCMNGERIIIRGAGPKMLLTAMIDDNVDDNIVLPIIEETAQIIKSMS